MKVQEIREMQVEQLRAKISDSREELMKLRFQLSSGELTDYTRLRQMRQSIARLTSVLNERRRNPESEETHE